LLTAILKNILQKAAKVEDQFRGRAIEGLEKQKTGRLLQLGRGC